MSNDFGITYTNWIAGVLGMGFTAISGIDKNNDGTVQTAEAFNAVQLIVLQALSNTPQNFDIKELKNELGDLTSEEKLVIKQEFARVAQVQDNPKLELIVEKVFNILIDTIELIFIVNEKPSM